MAVFDENTPISEVTIDALVGEGKKFKTPDDLARGKAESDRVIAARERELAELREELAKRVTTEELFQKFQQQRQTQDQSAGNERQQEPVAERPSLTDEDLEKRIQETLSKRTEQERTQANIAEVTNRLIAEFGTEDKANEIVNRKAAELGVSPAFLQDVAAKSPKAFYAQLGLNEAPKGTPPITRSDVRTESFQGSSGPKPGTYSYWEAQRQSMKPQEFFSARVQNQIMKDAFAAAERGEDFYKT